MVNSIAPAIEQPQMRIVQGTEVYPKFKYDSMVSLQINHEHSCGGTLITDKCVITAAHCTTAKGSEHLWTAKQHRHNLNKTSAEENGQTYQVIEFVDYPYYNKSQKLHDISIWRINNPKGNSVYRVDFEWTVLAEMPFSRVNVMGWGVTKHRGVLSQVLQEINIPVYPQDECEKNYRALGKPFDRETQFCGGDLDGGKDACTGDSGGPLFTVGFDGRMKLEGLVSWGKDCGVKGQPGIYTNVAYYINWIVSTCY